MRRDTIKRFVLPGFGLGLVLVIWTMLSQTVAPDLPSPAKTWAESRRYVLDPFFKHGEMNQGIGRLAFYSLVRVGKGFGKGGAWSFFLLWLFAFVGYFILGFGRAQYTKPA